MIKGIYIRLKHAIEWDIYPIQDSVRENEALKGKESVGGIQPTKKEREKTKKKRKR